MTISELRQPILRELVLKESLKRDYRVSDLESKARKLEDLFFNINGEQESKRYFREAAELRLQASALRRQPIELGGVKYSVIGDEVYVIK